MKHALIYYNNDDLLYLIKELKRIYKFKHYTILKTGERAKSNHYYEADILGSINQLNNINFDCAFVISESPFVNKMYYELHELGISKVYTINSEYLSLLDKSESIEKIITCFDLQEKALIGYLETHLFNKCNLNCKGCTHFLNIYDSSFMDTKKYEKNISKLSKLYNINTFRLMGGEPLLNKNLDEYIKVTRKYFPNSNIDIATNGLLICKLNDNLIKTIKANNIVLKISLYLPIQKIKNKIENFLNNKGILHFYGNGCKQVDNEVLIRDFHKCLTLKKQFDPVYNSNNCFARECWFLKDTLIAKCATPLQVSILNDKYNTKFIVEENDYIDISKIDISSWKDIGKLLSPINFCSYCSPIEKVYQWEIRNTNQQLSDYLIVEEEA